MFEIALCHQWAQESSGWGKKGMVESRGLRSRENSNFNPTDKNMYLISHRVKHAASEHKIYNGGNIGCTM